MMLAAVTTAAHTHRGHAPFPAPALLPTVVFRCEVWVVTDAREPLLGSSISKELNSYVNKYGAFKQIALAVSLVASGSFR